MILLSVTAIATRYWAGHLGCLEKDLFSQPLRIITHGTQLADYHGVFALFRGDAAMVSVPMGSKKVRQAISAEAVSMTTQILAATLSAFTERVVGPASISYASEVAPPTHPVRDLRPDDATARGELQRSCTPEEWEHGGGADGDPSFGVFVDGQLAALASYEVWGGAIAHISIVTHPAHRNRGYGRSAVAHVARRTLAAGLLPQYRTLEINGPSQRIARSLGFQSFARSLAIRLRPGV